MGSQLLINNTLDSISDAYTHIPYVVTNNSYKGSLCTDYYGGYYNESDLKTVAAAKALGSAVFRVVGPLFIFTGTIGRFSIIVL